MRLILLILLLCSLGADAQMIIKAHANYRPYAQPAANLLLDDYPNAAAAYSLRKLDKDYTGSAIRVRRSNDNAEQDIGFTSSGDLDTASLKTFVGSNSAFVTRWYDQMAINNLTCGVAIQQPRIVNAGTVERRNGDVSVFFDGSNDFLDGGPQYVLNSGYTIFGVVNVAGTSSSNRIGFYHSDRWGMALQRETGWGIQAVSDLAAVVTTSPSITQYTTGILSLTTGASYLTYSRYSGNGNVVQYGRNGTNAANSGTSGSTIRTGTSGLILYYTGYISECIIYHNDQSSNRTGIESNINTYYGIY